jgi:F-type H+-transporting ATPase subunit epsilon
MAAPTIKVDVVSAEESIFSGDAEFVVLPGIMGELGIYPRHAPLLTQIRPGAVRMKLPNQEQEELVFVQGGFLEVQPHHVTVLADTAIRAKDLDEKAALEAKRAAEEAMTNRSDKEEVAKAEAELASAVAQIQAIRKLKNRT